METPCMQPKGTSSPRPEPLNAAYLEPFRSRLANKRERQSCCKARVPKPKASGYTTVAGLASG